MNKSKSIGITIISIITILLIITYNNNILDLNLENLQEEKIGDKGIETEEIIYDNFTIKINDINKFINDEVVGYVYFGRDTCPICLEFNKVLEKLFNKNKNLLIYKFDTDYWRDNENFEDILKKYSISEIPILIKINKDQSYEIFKVDNLEEVQPKLENFLYK